MKHRLSFGDVPFYEAALLKLIQKYPPSPSVVFNHDSRGRQRCWRLYSPLYLAAPKYERCRHR